VKEVMWIGHPKLANAPWIRVLWISRHKPLKAQLDALKECLGKFILIQYKSPLPTAQHALSLIEKEQADVVVAVLPLSFMMHLAGELARREIVLLRADMEVIHNCEEVPCPDFIGATDTIMESISEGEKIYRHFRFRGFKRLKEVRLIEEEWCSSPSSSSSFSEASSEEASSLESEELIKRARSILEGY